MRVEIDGAMEEEEMQKDYATGAEEEGTWPRPATPQSFVWRVEDLAIRRMLAREKEPPIQAENHTEQMEISRMLVLPHRLRV
jgi:hypothetical protein